MQTYLTLVAALLLLGGQTLLISCSKPKYFTGTIEYQYTYSSAILDVDSLSKHTPHKSEFRYDNINYQSRFFAIDTTTYYYHGESGKCLSHIHAENRFECEDYRLPTDTVISYKEYKTDEKILGQPCKVIEWQGKYFYNILYVSTDVKISPATYRNHLAYNWKFYGEKADGGLILRSEHRFKNYTMKGMAVKMKKERRLKSLTIDTEKIDCFNKLPGD